MRKRACQPILLTAREKQVLQLIGRGKTTKEIAEILSISALTVSDHRKRICGKLGLHSTAELAAYGARAGNVDDSCVLPNAPPFA